MLTGIHAAASSLQYLENGSSVEAEGFHASGRVGCSIIAVSLWKIILIWGGELFELLPWTHKTLPKVEWGGDGALPSSSVCALLITLSAWTICVLCVPFIYNLTHCIYLQVFLKTWLRGISLAMCFCQCFRHVYRNVCLSLAFLDHSCISW